MKLFTVFLVIVYTTANFRNFPQNSLPHSLHLPMLPIFSFSPHTHFASGYWPESMCVESKCVYGGGGAVSLLYSNQVDKMSFA